MLAGRYIDIYCLTDTSKMVLTVALSCFFFLLTSSFMKLSVKFAIGNNSNNNKKNGGGHLKSAAVAGD